MRQIRLRISIAPLISVSILIIWPGSISYAYFKTAKDTVEANRPIPKSLLSSTLANPLLCIIVARVIRLTAGNLNALFSSPFGASGYSIGSII